MHTSIFLAPFLACHGILSLTVGRYDVVPNASSADGLPSVYARRFSAASGPSFHVNQFEETKVKDIFIVAGQSNAQGFGDKKLLPEEMQNMPSNVMLWSRYGGTAWMPWTDETLDYFNIPGLFGPEVSFAHELATHIYIPKNEKIGLIKIAKINTNLWSDWSPANWEAILKSDDLITKELAAAGQKSVMPGQEDHPFNDTMLPPGILFATMVDNARRALASDVCQKTRCQVKALLWVQGEADSISRRKSREYKKNLDNLFSTFKAAIGMPDMKVIIPQLNWNLTNRWRGTPSVIQAQKGFVETQGQSNAALIKTNDLTKISDAIHYDAAGLVELGRRAAWAYRHMMESDDNVSEKGAVVELRERVSSWK